MAELTAWFVAVPISLIALFRVFGVHLKTPLHGASERVPARRANAVEPQEHS